MKNTSRRHVSNQTGQPPAVHGEYSRHGYEVWISGCSIYSAGDNAHDSNQPAMRQEDRLPLRAIRKFCIMTTREVAVERVGVYAGVERVSENDLDSS